MIERLASLSKPGVEQATVMVIGGALTRTMCQGLYDGQLGTDEYMAARKRFFPNPPENVRDFDETFRRIEAMAEDVYSLGNSKRLLVVGHSFGGLPAVKLGLTRPDIVGHVKCLAGLQEGYADTIGVRAVKKLVGGDIKNAEHARAGSNHILSLKEEVATDWPSSVGLSLHSAMFDICFPLPQGLGLELPEGQQPSRRVVGPRLAFLAHTLRHNNLPPGTTLLPELLPMVDHILLPLSPADIRDTMRIRAELAAEEVQQPELRVAALPKPQVGLVAA